MDPKALRGESALSIECFDGHPEWAGLPVFWNPTQGPAIGVDGHANRTVRYTPNHRIVLWIDGNEVVGIQPADQRFGHW